MDSYLKRHIGPQDIDEKAMLALLGKSSLDTFIDELVPSSIALKKALNLEPALSEYELEQEIQKIAKKNKLFKSYIGLGYYDCITPAVIKRNILENPGWYTQYTPYQSEISQGRLAALFHFQTMIVELTGMEVANASLLDEATAAAEAMTMLYRHRSKKALESQANTFFVSENCFPQSIAVLRTRAESLGIQMEVGDELGWEKEGPPQDKYYGLLLQYPNVRGAIADYRPLISQAKANHISVAMACDLLALTLLESPASLGADVAVGSSQRFGVPMGYGGPHAAYFATRKSYQRSVPGRIVGLSVDRLGQEAYRLALQTREQHIRREKAGSNICTSQALLAIMAAMYAIYHGPQGITKIALRIHSLTQLLKEGIEALGLDLDLFEQKNKYYFDTLYLHLKNLSLKKLKQCATEKQVNLGYDKEDERGVRIALNETTKVKDIQELLDIFAKAASHTKKVKAVKITELCQAKIPKRNSKHSIEQKLSQSFKTELPEQFLRKDAYLSQEIFHEYRSETAMMRYMRQLEGMDLALNQVMIPLGSCTMKLNPAAAMMPLSIAEFADLHPFVPLEQAVGYQQIFQELESYLAEITGLPKVSLQPNSGAQGEYAGLLLIRAYHRDRGEAARKIALVPVSAHGTNPASAAMAGMEVVFVNCDPEGNINLKELKEKIKSLAKELACIMITYPSTHGVFEEQVQEVSKLVHEHGGLVYLDGANMNAQVGLCSPHNVGADVCHLNLHKTFSIPHGGGGPGMGPICVNEKLAPYLPGHCMIDGLGGTKGISALTAAPWSSASILLISYAYIRLLGGEGMRKASQTAILNANYLKKRLEKAYNVLYTDRKGYVAHEMILDMRPFRKYGIEVEDIAKRLIDYSFHAPTMSWPVPGSLMIEPTESEPKKELDRFSDAMLKIRAEIEEVIENQNQDQTEAASNILKNAPHPPQEIASSNWQHPYSRQKAAFPLKNNFKFWPPLARVDNAYGDRNLVCSCPPLPETASMPEAIPKEEKKLSTTLS